MSPEILHYFAAAFAVLFSSAGTAIGQGIAGGGSVDAHNRQPMGNAKSFRALLMGLALTESGGILALVLSFMLLFGMPETFTWGMGWAELGLGLSIGLSAAAVGIASGFAVHGACSSIARQPFFDQKIVTLMLLSQSMIEAPVIFAFIVSLLIKTRVTDALSTFDGIKLCAAGIAMGLGCLGPSLGQAFFSSAACSMVGVYRKSYQKIFSFSLLSQALIETPVIYCLLLAVMLIFRPIQPHDIAKLISFCAAAFCISFASIGNGIGTGYVASRSCYQIAKPDSDYGAIFRATLLSQVFIESSTIYALIIALLLVMRS